LLSREGGRGLFSVMSALKQKPEGDPAGVERPPRGAGLRLERVREERLGGEDDVRTLVSRCEKKRYFRKMPSGIRI